MKKSRHFQSAMNAGVVALLVFGVITAAVLFGAREPSSGADASTVNTQQAADPQPIKAAVAARPEPKKTVAPRESPLAVQTNVPASDATTRNGAAAESLKALASEPGAKTDAQRPAPVTITGCVELDEETYWLKETAGEDVPTSRSWKSGFLKRHPSPIELVDAANTLKLRNYVGQRVAATGTIVNREMRAHSLQRVTASCNKNPKV